MKNTLKRLTFATGLAATLLFAAWRVYNRRSRARVVSQEGLDDPDVAQAFNRIATMPQMRLLRWLAIRRAVAMKQAGAAPGERTAGKSGRRLYTAGGSAPGRTVGTDRLARDLRTAVADHRGIPGHNRGALLKPMAYR